MKVTVDYILAQPNFFLEGARGRVSHASGFVSGLCDNGISVNVYSGKSANKYIKKRAGIQFINCGQLFFNIILFIRLLKSSSQVMVFRWRPHLAYLVILLLFRKSHKIWFEVNGLTGMNSGNPIIRLYSRLSLWIVAKFFKTIVVSENSRRLIENLIGKNIDCCVIRNGFFPEFFINFQPKLSLESKSNLVYFGRKQPYYDWEMLYLLLGNALISQLDKFHVLGFKDKNTLKLNFLGPYELINLTEQLNNIENPILILPANNSELAKSGSPMKLYEFASLGVPVIISDSLKEQTNDIRGFIYYRAGNATSLENCISDVSLNYQRYLSLSSELKSVVVNKYSWPSVVKPWAINLS